MSNRVRLILGSGGARGLAHIGVIRELEARDFEVHSVIGCSMGALVGGFHCAGELDTYAEWVSNLSEWDVMRLLDVSLTAKNGVLKGDLIVETLKELIGDRKIEELDKPFTAVATDIVERKEVWIDSGGLFDAIRASIAVPGAFAPKKINGRLLVDGGLLNPLPGAPLTLDDTDLTVAVSLAGPEMTAPLGPEPPENSLGKIDKYGRAIDGFVNRVQEKLGMEPKERETEDRELSLTDILLSSFDTMQSCISRYRLAAHPPDVLIEIPGNVSQAHEFWKARALIYAGQHWAAEALDRQTIGHEAAG